MHWTTENNLKQIYGNEVPAEVQEFVERFESNYHRVSQGPITFETLCAACAILDMMRL